MNDTHISQIPSTRFQKFLQASRYSLILKLVIVTISILNFGLKDVNAFSSHALTSSNEIRRFSNTNGDVRMYLQPSSQNTDQQGFKSKSVSNENTKSKPFVSSSSLQASAHATYPVTAVASSDVLPSFKAAHGLLHPHTFMKLRDNYELHGGGDAIRYFLDTYLESGPMSCIRYLSDPEVLPQLTQAMRSIDDI